MCLYLLNYWSNYKMCKRIDILFHIIKLYLMVTILRNLKNKKNHVNKKITKNYFFHKNMVLYNPVKFYIVT